VLVRHYLDTVLAADRKMVAKVFHIFRWSSQQLGRTIEGLLQEGSVREVAVDGLDGPRLLSTRWK